jgi:predicted Rossmann fold flavoprotein
MTTRNEPVDVIIIGGGPAGMMAALSVRHHHPDYAITILDRTFELGRKFLTSGAGRGNLTNVNLESRPEGYYHGDQTFISSVFSRFGYRDIMNFFGELGVPTYEEKKTSRGKIFPAIDHAKTVRDVLVDALIEKNVRIVTNVSIQTITQKDGGWELATPDAIYIGKAIIMTPGGQTYPALGADGSGYALAASLGHTIIPPVVTAVPVVAKNPLSHYMQGEKMIMQATSIIGGTEKTTAVGDVMFTQYGFSGPAIFDISHDLSVRINREKKRDTAVRLSFFPGKTREEVHQLLAGRFARRASFPVAHSLWGLFTQKTSGAICTVSGLSKELLAKDMTSTDREQLLATLTDFVAEVSDTRGWNEGEFTAGGVSTDEIDHQSLMSKKAMNIYLAGEILNVDGQVGGFNLSWAWATGWLAGKLETNDK